LSLREETEVFLFFFLLSLPKCLQLTLLRREEGERVGEREKSSSFFLSLLSLFPHKLDSKKAQPFQAC